MDDETSDELAQLRAELVALGTRLVRLQEGTTATEADLLAIESAALVIATRVQVWRASLLDTRSAPGQGQLSPGWWRARHAG